MTNSDPRLELARRLAQAKRNKTPLALGSKVNVQTTGITDPKTRSLYNQVSSTGMSITQRNPNLAEQVKRVTAGKQKGAIGSLLAPVLGAVSAIDLPRRAVISGVREAVDYLDTDPNTKASISDFTKQAKDASYGFGTAFPMKGNWGRFAGFVGDVALDPLTYATAGASGAATFTQRAALAPTLLQKGIPEAVVSNFLQRGKTALTRAGVTGEQLADMGLKRSGVYMFGSKLRVPLSGPVGEVVLSGLSSAKVFGTKTRIGETLQRGFMGMGKNQEEWVRNLRLSLARNEPIPESMVKGLESVSGMGARTAAIHLLGANTAREAAQNIAKQEFSVNAAMKLKEIGVENIEPYRNTVHQVLEGSRVATDPVEAKLAEDLRGLYKGVWDKIDAGFKTLDPTSSIGFQPEYFPWVITDEARKISTDLQTPWVKDLMTVLEPNPLDPQGSFKSRNLKEGNKWFWTMENGVKKDYFLTADDIKSIDRLNQISRGAIGVDFFKTDAVDVLVNSYIDSASKQMGLLGMFEDLNRTGVVRKTLREAGPHMEMANAHAAAMDLLVQERSKAMAEVEKAVAEAVDAVNGYLPKVADGLDEVVIKTEKELAEATLAASRQGLVVPPAGVADDLTAIAGPVVQEAVVSQASLKTAKQNLANAKRALTNMRTQFDNIFETDMPELLVAAQTKLDAQISTIDDLELMITSLQDEANSLRKSLSTTRGQITRIEKKLPQLDFEEGWARQAFDEKMRQFNFASSALREEMDLAAKQYEQYVELSNILKSRMDDIVDGKRIASVQGRRIKSIIAGNARLGKMGDAPVALENFGANPGALNDWIQKNIGNLDFFKEISEYLPPTMLNAKAVRNMNIGEVFDIVARGAVGAESNVDSINAAMYLLARDAKFYGDNIPSNLVKAHQDLREMLLAQAESVGFYERAKIGDTIESKVLKANKQFEHVEEKLIELESLENDFLDVIDWVKSTMNDIADGAASSNDQLAEDFFLSMDDTFRMFSNGIEDDATLGEALQKARALLDRVSVTVDQHGLPAKTYRLSDMEELSRFQQTVLAQKEKIQSESKKSLRTFGQSRLNLSAKELAMTERGTEAGSKELANRLAAYAVMSEVERRFKSLGMELAGLGHIPTEEMYVTIMRKVAGEQLESVASRESSIATGTRIMNEIRSSFEEVMGNYNKVGYAGESPTDMMDRLLEEAYSGPYASAMEDTWGPIEKYQSGNARLIGKRNALKNDRKEQYFKELDSFVEQNQVVFGNIVDQQNLAKSTNFSDMAVRERTIKNLLKDLVSEDFDPGVLNLKNPKDFVAIRQRAFELIELDRQTATAVRSFDKDYLKPWFHSVMPYSKYTLAEAKKAIGTSVPFKNEFAIKRFFTDMLGGKRRNAASYVGTNSPGLLIVDDVRGRMAEEFSNLVSRRVRLTNMLDPEATAEEFLSNPFGLPTRSFAYIDSLSSLADTMEQQIARLKNLDSTKTIIGFEKSGAKATQKAKAAADVLAETAPVGPVRYNPLGEYPLTAEKDRNMARAIQTMRSRYDRLTSTPEYAIAMHDKEMTDVLSKLAPIDGHAVRDLQTGEAGWVIDPKPNKVKLSDFGLDDARAGDYHVVEEVSGGFDNDSFLMDPTRTRVVRVSTTNMDLIDSQVKQIEGVAKRLLKLNPDDPEVDVLLAEAKSLRFMQRDWKHVKLKTISASDEVNVNNVFKVQTNLTVTGTAEGFELEKIIASGGATGEQALIKISDVIPEVRFATENKFATFINPKSTSVRRKTADYLFANNVIDDAMRTKLNSNTPIDRVLNELIRLPDGSSTSLNDIIRNWEYSLGGETAASIEEFQSNVVGQLSTLEGKLSFTEDEWGSLFATPFNGTEAARHTNLIKSTETELARFKKFASEGKGYVYKNVDGVEKRISVQKRIKDLEKELTTLNLEQKTRSKATQSSALAKFQQLYDQLDNVRIQAKNDLDKWRIYAQEGIETVQVPNGKGGFSSVNVAKQLEKLEKKAGAGPKNIFGTVDNFVSSRSENFTTKQSIDFRRTGLQRSWESTSSYGLVSQVDAIKKSDEMELFQSMRSGVKELEKTRDDILKAIKDKRSNNSYIEKELLDTAQQIIDSVDRMGIENLDPQTVDSLVNSIRDAFVVDAQNIVKSVKYDGLTKAIPKSTRDLIDNIRASFPEKLPQFTVDEGVLRDLELAIASSRTNLSTTSWAMAKQIFEFSKDSTSPLNAQINAARQRLVTLTAKEAEDVAKQTAVLQRIADALQLSQETRATIQREWIDGYNATAKGNVSASKSAKFVKGKIATAEDRVIAANALYTYIKSEFDSILPRYEIARDVSASVNAELRPKVAEMRRLVDESKKLGKKVRAETKTSTWGGKTTVKEANLAEFEKLLAEAENVINQVSLKPDDALNAVYAEVARAQTVYANTLMRTNQMQAFNQIETARLFPSYISDEIAKRSDEAYQALSSAGLNGMEAPQEVINMFGELRRFKDPAFSRGFGNFINGYTGFFKRYATLSPGFHIRNAMSNSFALLAAGGDVRNFSPGLKMYAAMEKALNEGVPLQTWVNSIADPIERSRAEVASRSMFAAGGGQTNEAFSAFLSKDNVLKKLESNMATRFSHAVGSKIENSARFMLGYDSAVKGFDFNVATARTKRFLIDYEDVGEFDRAMKAIVPFWMWTSRALPMHITNMWLNPKPYQMYRSFERNYEVKDKMDLTPEWIKNAGGFKITGGMYLMPDLGFNKIPETLSQVSEPSKLLSNLNPALRVPLELAANKQFFNNRQFTGTPKDVSGGGVNSALAPLLEMLGMAGTNQKGEMVANEKALYVLSNLIPTLGQAERLLPSGQTGKSNYLGYLGVPLRPDSESLRQSALYEKLNELNKLEKSQGF